MQHPDQTYIIALYNHDRKLIKEIYDKFLPKIKWMVLQNNGDENDAKNIFQDALTAIYLKKNFELTCPFDAFIYAVCWRKWMSELKKRGRGWVTSLELGEYNILGQDDLKVSDEVITYDARRKLFGKTFSKLSEGCRKLLVLNWSGKSMKEVASTLGIRYNFARKKKSGCMAKLIAMIKDSSDFDSTQW